MNFLKLSLKNLLYRPLNLTLSVVLFALGIGLVSLMFNLNKQIQDQLDSNLAGIDLVIAAKGSPLQAILCNMYHIDNPTGNISMEEAIPFLRPANPLIQKAVPISLGDNYKGYRIVGTTIDFPELYNAEIDAGRMWEYDFEVTVGSSAARHLNLNVGDEFHGSHGLGGDDMHVHDYVPPYVVKGILKPTGAVIDNLIITNTASVWMVHHDHDHDHDHHHHDGHHSDTEHSHAHDHSHNHNHDHSHDHKHHGEHHSHAHDHSHDHSHNHDHSHDHNHHDHGHGPGCGHHHDFHTAEDQKGSNKVEHLLDFHGEAITAILVKYRGRNIQTLNLPRQINQNTNMMAASPSYEINRLFDMMGTGIEAIGIMGWIIAIVSGFSIFISLFQSLSRRKYELALMRVMGSSRNGLFTLIILEGLWISIFGYLAGMVLSRLGMLGVAGMVESGYRYQINPFEFIGEDGMLLGAALVIGFIAAVIPAVFASKTDIAKTLSSK
ncbi:MAG: ABC transporter permease [Saprospirales bacterium]|nr:MAG: ABC transporter permease [Saprospirales bacterium]